MTKSVERAEAAEANRSEAATEIAALKESMERVRIELEVTRLEAQHERTAKEAALKQAADLEGRLADETAASQRQLDEQRTNYERQLNAQRDRLAASEASLSEELGRATES